MADRRKLLQELWTATRLRVLLPKIIECLGSQAHDVWFDIPPMELVEKLELTDRLDIAPATVVVETLRDLALLEISRRPTGEHLGFWVRTGTLAALMHGREPVEVEAMLDTFLGYAEEPRCRSG